MTLKPPREIEADVSALNISPDRCQIVDQAVAVDEAQEGIQILPVGIYMPERRKHPLGQVCIRGFAWSASNYPPYQRASNQLYADVLGMPVVAPNSVGMGIGSPELTLKQIDELKKGKATDLGRVSLDASLKAYQTFHEPICAVAMIGDSFDPSLHPARLENLPDDIEVSHIIWATPAGTRRRGPRAGLVLPMAVTAIPGMNLDAYRAFNPPHLDIDDTDINTSMKTQRAAHLFDYPHLLSSGRLVSDTVEQLHKRDLKPEIHIVAATKDLVSPIHRNKKATSSLGASLHELKGHYHPVTDYRTFMARILANILDVEIPLVYPRTDG